MSVEAKKWPDLPYYSLDGLIGVMMYVEELQLLPSNFSPSGSGLRIKIRSMLDEEGVTWTDSTPLILYLQRAKLPLKGWFAYREGSFDITFIPK